MKQTITIGTRGSKLALTQTKAYAELLKSQNPELEVSIQIIKTTGDQNQKDALAAIGEKGIFTKEIEEALLNGEIDLAVHSMKDLPSVLPEGLTLANPPKRADSRDILVFREGAQCGKLKIGTGSLRRKVQILELFTEAEVLDIRGNVDTRLRKLKEGQYDAILLAKAGLERLNIDLDAMGLIPYELPESFLPAPAQGILGIEIRENDERLKALTDSVCDPVTALQMRSERTFLEVLEGSCHIPIAASAVLDADHICLRALFGNEQEAYVRGETCDSLEEIEKSAAALALRLREELTHESE